jgi:putative OPT family oligopeptide transporter
MNREFTLRAMLVGLVLAVIFGAATVYLGLKAGLIIGATFPAAVLGMALLRLFKHSTILEENIARTIGSIGVSVAVGAIFILPAFLIAGVWSNDFFGSFSGYWQSTVVLLVGGMAGVLFATLLRRSMVEDRELPFPESAAAAEIHKAGRGGRPGARYLFYAVGIGGLIEFLVNFSILKKAWAHFVGFAERIIPASGLANYGVPGFKGVNTAGGFVLKSPSLSPAFLGIGYIIGPRLTALIFAGGFLAWGLLVPLFLLVLAPQFAPFLGAPFVLGGKEVTLTWEIVADHIVFSSLVRPIAIGGLLVSAAYTLFAMANKLVAAFKRTTAGGSALPETDRDINMKTVFAGLLVMAAVAFGLHWWRLGFAAEGLGPSLAIAVVMLMAGFFFAGVSGYLVGIIGSAHNPISGLTISILLVAALLIVLMGTGGREGVIMVLALTGVVCVAAAAAGVMLQDLKVGHILGAAPWKMQAADFIGVIVSALVMWIPLFILNAGDLNRAAVEGYQGGFGGRELAAPEAGLMARLAKGIVGGEMVWPLIIVGMAMAVVFMLVRVKSPLLVCVGMYLHFETAAAIFVGGMIRWLVDTIVARRKFNENQKTRVGHRGLLIASGLIAGEALMGLVLAALVFFDVKVPKLWMGSPYWVSLLVMAGLGYLLVKVPLDSAGDPDEPAAL